MLSPDQNAAVVRWLRQESRRPVLALTLWGELFTALRHDTGEVTMTRDELAERIGAAPGDVSRVMGELSSVNAITVRRERVAGVRGPGLARYFMNPLVATNLAGVARDRAQAGAPALTVVGGGKS